MLSREVLKSNYIRLTKALKESTKQSIKLKVPSLTSSTTFTFYTIDAFVSGVSSDDIGKNTIFNLDTLEITILYEDMVNTGCPKKNFQQLNIVVIYDNVEYNINKEKPSDFGKDFAITLYTTRKS